MGIKIMRTGTCNGIKNFFLKIMMNIVLSLLTWKTLALCPVLKARRFFSFSQSQMMTDRSSEPEAIWRIKIIFFFCLCGLA